MITFEKLYKRPLFWIILLLGFSLPASVWAENKGPEGLSIFKDQKCNKCHTLDAYGIGKLPEEEDEFADDLDEDFGEEEDPPDLSQLSDKVLKAPDPRVYLQQYLKKKLKRDGKKHKKRFKGSDEAFSTLIDFLMASSQTQMKKSLK